MLNHQKPEQAATASNGALTVHTIFRTIQGEGPFSGCRAVFIRLADCNLQCPKCDTDYTSHKIPMESAEIVALVEGLLPRQGLHLVVITGGEPLRQDLAPLVGRLLDLGYLVQIETNGTLFQPLPFHRANLVIGCSPKTGSINRNLLPHIDFFKYVLCAADIAEDGLPTKALDHPCKPRLVRPPSFFAGTVYIQPADEQDPQKNQRNLAAAVKSAQDFGHTLCLQLHKHIGVE